MKNRGEMIFGLLFILVMMVLMLCIGIFLLINGSGDNEHIAGILAVGVFFVMVGKFLDNRARTREVLAEIFNKKDS